MNDALGSIRTRNTVTPQTEQVLGRDDQVKNNAGGFVFSVKGEDRVKRFLMLGTDGGTYYQKEQPYTLENARVVIDFATNHGSDLVLIVRDISGAGRAPRQNPALFALAAVFAFGDEPAKNVAKAYFNEIVRTRTHLFIFVKYTEQLRCWCRSVKSAVAGWYTGKNARDLSYQMIKYRQRENWTHRDVLRSAHPKTSDDEKRALLAWATHPEQTQVTTPGSWVSVYEAVQALGRSGIKDGKPFANLIRDNPGLPWEALPDVALTYPETWEALISQGMPITALIRQLPRLTNLGLTSGDTLAKITATLTDEDKLRKGRVHPVKLLYALKTYAGGHSLKGKSTWNPASKITDALAQSFYTSFGTVEPAGKRTLIGLDVSGSMGSWGWSSTQDSPITPAEGSMAMAMVSLATEPEAEIM